MVTAPPIDTPTRRKSPLFPSLIRPGVSTLLPFFRFFLAYEGLVYDRAQITRQLHFFLSLPFPSPFFGLKYNPFLLDPLLFLRGRGVSDHEWTNWAVQFGLLSPPLVPFSLPSFSPLVWTAGAFDIFSPFGFYRSPAAECSRLDEAISSFWSPLPFLIEAVSSFFLCSFSFPRRTACRPS